MPMQVDHDERRAIIIGGLLDIAARDGLHTVTMRGVAAAAGVTLRQVQYYFGSKQQLMHAALSHLEHQSMRRWSDRIGQLPTGAGNREILDAYFDEALPLTDDSRAFHIVFTAYTTLAMTDHALARQPFIDGPRRLQTEISTILATARDAGEIPAHTDPDTEAARLVAFQHGLGTALLICLHTPATARSLVTYHLDALFTPKPHRHSRANARRR